MVIINKISHKSEKPRTDDFTTEFYPTFKQELTSVLEGLESFKLIQ